MTHSKKKSRPNRKQKPHYTERVARRLVAFARKLALGSEIPDEQWEAHYKLVEKYLHAGVDAVFNAAIKNAENEQHTMEYLMDDLYTLAELVHQQVVFPDGRQAHSSSLLFAVPILIDMADDKWPPTQLPNVAFNKVVSSFRAHSLVNDAGSIILLNRLYNASEINLPPSRRRVLLMRLIHSIRNEEADRALAESVIQPVDDKIPFLRYMVGAVDQIIEDTFPFIDTDNGQMEDWEAFVTEALVNGGIPVDMLGDPVILHQAIDDGLYLLESKQSEMAEDSLLADGGLSPDTLLFDDPKTLH